MLDVERTFDKQSRASTYSYILIKHWFMKYLSVLSLGLKETNLILNHSLAHIKKAKGSFKPTLFSKINRRKFLRNRTTSSEFHSYFKKQKQKTTKRPIPQGAAQSNSYLQ